jgi:hypothetical protein
MHRALILVAAFAFSSALGAVQSAPGRSGRLWLLQEGGVIEFSPGDEELARRVAAATLAAHPDKPVPQAPSAQVPMSAAELRANRAKYLHALCRLLALKAPTPLQEEAFDAFVRIYEQQIELGLELHRKWSVPSFVSLWRREDLIQRLERGESLPGFSYDPVTKQGRFELRTYLPPPARALAERKRALADYSYVSNFQGSARSINASVSSRGRADKPLRSDAPPDASDAPFELPVVIKPEDAGRPVDELVEISRRHISDLLHYNRGVIAGLIDVDPKLAMTALHEAAEAAIIDRYISSRDRRWFSDGVANYAAWRVLRDLHGDVLARRAYDQELELRQYAQFRDKVDLRAWKAAEDQTEEEKNSPLNSAHYAFATQAVLLMERIGGERVVPRIFAQLERTPKRATTMPTVEAAWRRTTRRSLDEVLSLAVAESPASGPRSDTRRQ